MNSQSWYSVVAILAVAAACVAPAATRVAPIDLARHAPDDTVNLRLVGEREYEWHLPDGNGQRLHVDLPAQGIDPGLYDEFRFDIRPQGSQVALHTIVTDHPQPGQASSWYLKFKAPRDKWSQGRYDLHLDDDGVFVSKSFSSAPQGQLELRLGRRLLGFPGEPVWRKAGIRNPRFVKHLISADFDLLEAELQEDAAEIAYVYPLRVRNRTQTAQMARINLGGTNTLHYFTATAPKTVALAPGEEKVVAVRIAIPRMKALTLPPLYAEPLYPIVHIEGVEDSDVTPLMGYRRWPMWGVVPVFNPVVWTPPTMQAYLDARSLAMPGIEAWKQGVLSRANSCMNTDWVVPDFGPPGHDQGYRCGDCRCWLRPAAPMSFHKHVCPTCKKVFVDNEKLDRAFLCRYYSARCTDIRNCALAWLLTDKEAYALKAVSLLLMFADKQDTMPVTGLRSTSGGGRIGPSTLLTTYSVRDLGEAYAYLYAAPCLTEATRPRVESFIKGEAARVVRHSVEYNNQQAEHMCGYGNVGIATRFWPMAAEAVYGEFGWHELVEYGFSDDGIGHEGGVYHNAMCHAMDRFAIFAYSQGVNLFTPRFKRVFDGSLLLGAPGLSYELGYRVYRDPAYLGRLEQQRARIGETAALHGLLGIASASNVPVTSTLMSGAGYVFLRTGNIADSREIRINYIKSFDRSEHDRLTTFFYRNGNQIDGTVGRITYGSPHSGWMEATAAHNTIVIDGSSSRRVDAQLVAYETSGETALAVMRSDPANPLYEGVTQARGVAIIDDAYVVFDRVTCDRPRTVDRYQYGRGKATLGVAVAPHRGEFSCRPPHGAFSGIEGAPCGRELRVDFANGLRMRLVSDQDMHTYRAITVGGYQANPMETTFARVSEAAEVTCLAAFTFGKETEPPQVRIIRSDPGGMVFAVEGTDGTREWKVDMAGGYAHVTTVH